MYGVLGAQGVHLERVLGHTMAVKSFAFEGSVDGKHTEHGIKA